MPDNLSCPEVAMGFVIERYIARTLPEPEVVAFEEHLLSCASCQRTLSLAAAIREALPGARPRDFGAIRWRRVMTIALAAAAGLAVVFLGGRDRVPEHLLRLGNVEQAPVYLGVAVRQEAATRPDSLFDGAMASYAAGDFATAADGLADALAAGADPVPAWFFAGASLLMLDRATEAAEAFGKVIGAGTSPYLAEAHYYRAKARLRRGEVGAALEDLNVAGADRGGMAAEASALTDSIENTNPP